MAPSVDTTTKLSHLLPTGTFLTFQVLAPLSTNNGKCGLTERVLTSVTLGVLVLGCILTSFTDSYTAPDGRVYGGFVTRQGLWVPGGYEVDDVVDDNQATGGTNTRYFVAHPDFKIRFSDFLNATLSSVAFLTLTLFTDPVATCFYPHISETVLKTLPVLLTALISFFCPFSGKVRRGFGNAYPTQRTTNFSPGPALVPGARDETRIPIKEDHGQESLKVQ